jgi:hypothetical protein
MIVDAAKNSAVKTFVEFMVFELSDYVIEFADNTIRLRLAPVRLLSRMQAALLAFRTGSAN